MDKPFWHQKWESNEIAFHCSEANPLLVKYFDKLSLAKGARVFLPLCGKSLDIPWLLSNGFRAVGAELCRIAVEQLFSELGVEPKISRVESVDHYSAKDIDIFVGDIFDLSREMLGPVDAVYDRAALVALPADMRNRYTAQVTAITDEAPQILICYEYDQSLMEGPPFSINGEEINQRYGEMYHLDLMATQKVPDGLKGIRAVNETVWLLTDKSYMCKSFIKDRDEEVALTSERTNPFRESSEKEFMMKPIIAKRSETDAGSAEQTPSAWWALASLSLSMLLSSLDTSIANVALPTLAQTFSASFQKAQWVVIAYLLAITTLIVSVGRLGDITDRRRLLLAGIFLFTVASVLSGVAPTLWLLIAARALQGLGGAIMMALTMAIVGETVPRAKIGSAMGLLGTMSAVGTALGPSLGGALIAGFSWRAIFLVNVPLGILTFFLSYHYLPVDRLEPKTDRAGFDNVGTLLLALTLAAYALAVTIGRGSFGSLNIALLLAAVFGVGLFVLVEARAASPLIPLAMFHDPVLSSSLAMSVLVATVVTTTLVVGPFYLSLALGLDAARVGLVLSAGPLVAALTAVPAGRFADRLGAQRMTIVGLIAMAAGSAILSMIPARLGISGFIAPIVVITGGYSLFQTANNTAIMTDILPHQRGVISGMLNLSRNLGRITGASVMGAVFALASATSNITTARPEAVATGMRTTFAVGTILIVVALAIAVGSLALSRHALRPRAATAMSARPSGIEG